MTITKLVGVYDADGSLAGELAYVVRSRLGQAHCGLCDVTHGRVRERRDWRRCRDELPVPFATYHRDDQPAAVRAAGGPPPFVVAETVDGTHHGLLDGEAIDACAGSPERLVEALRAAAAREGLDWPT